MIPVLRISCFLVLPLTSAERFDSCYFIAISACSIANLCQSPAWFVFQSRPRDCKSMPQVRAIGDQLPHARVHWDHWSCKETQNCKNKNELFETQKLLSWLDKLSEKCLLSFDTRTISAFSGLLKNKTMYILHTLVTVQQPNGKPWFTKYLKKLLDEEKACFIRRVSIRNLPES